MRRLWGAARRAGDVGSVLTHPASGKFRGVPMPKKGVRARVTVRVPIDDFREAATRARSRRWSMSEYVAYCIEREIRPTPNRGTNNRSPYVPVAIDGDDGS